MRRGLRGWLGRDAGPPAEARPRQGLEPGRIALSGAEAHPSSVEEPETPAAQRAGNALTVAERVQLYRSLTEATEPSLQAGPSRRRSCSDSLSPSSQSRPSSSPVAKARKLFGDSSQSCNAEGSLRGSRGSIQGQAPVESPRAEVPASVSPSDGASGGLHGDRPTLAVDGEAESRSTGTRDVAEEEDVSTRGVAERGEGQGGREQDARAGPNQSVVVSGKGGNGPEVPDVAVPWEPKELRVHEISAHTTDGSPDGTPSPPP